MGEQRRGSDEGDRPDEQTIDLRGPARLVGESGTCPDCGGHGHLDRLDILGEAQHEHCEACGLRWATPFSELAGVT